MLETDEGKLAEILDQATKLEEMGDEHLNSGDLKKAKENYLQCFSGSRFGDRHSFTGTINRRE